jgi:hypothetical protein
MPAKKKKKSSFGRNTPFGAKSALTVAQRGTAKYEPAKQMTQKQLKAYVDKANGEAKLAKKVKRPPVPKKGPGQQPGKHNKYYK